MINNTDKIQAKLDGQSLQVLSLTYTQTHSLLNSSY